ncbi:MAG: LacI family DNA-binding transcriptional regulator [Planctomycetota bacterium]
MSIVDVAKAAGLSHSTVSRVINQRPGVAPETAAAVRRAMQSIGYTPPAKRRGPKPKGRIRAETGNIGLLMVGTETTFARAPVTATVFHAAEKAVAKHGFNLIVGQLDDGGRLPPDVAKGHIDGLLLHGYPPPLEFRHRLAAHPSVWMLSQRSSRDYFGDRVCPDNEFIGRIAAEHLIRHGHKRLAYMYFSATHMGFRARAESFQDTAEELGATVELIAENPSDRRPKPREEFGIEHTEKLVERLLSMKPMPTGVFVPRDRLAVRLYRCLRDHGIEPGRDVEIVSCDNEPILDALDPRPATIDVQAESIGECSVQQLVYRMQHPQRKARALITIEPVLIDASGQEFKGVPSASD